MSSVFILLTFFIWEYLEICGMLQYTSKALAHGAIGRVSIPDKSFCQGYENMFEILSCEFYFLLCRCVWGSLIEPFGCLNNGTVGTQYNFFKTGQKSI